MKKIALSLAVLFTVALVACDNKGAKAESESVVESAQVTEVVEEAAVNESESAVEAPVAEEAPAAEVQQ